MRSPRPCFAALALTLASGLASAQTPAWITVGDEAWQLLQRQRPEAQLLSSRSVAIELPARPGSATRQRGSERVHAVQVDEAALPGLTMSVHEELRRCGGYMRHESQAEALAVLHRLGSVPRALARASYAIDDRAEVEALLPLLQSSHLLATIEQLANFQNRTYNTSHGVAVSDWLAQQWSTLAAGRRGVSVRQINHRGWPQKSVRLRIRGSQRGAETLVLGAHLDSIAGGGGENSRAPGADDDASGVAALTELIRVMMASGYQPKRTIEFIAYAAEEVGLRGSQQIAAQYASRGKAVAGVLQLDMTAYQGDPTDLWIFTDYTDAAQNQFLVDLAGAYLPQLGIDYDRCGYACSDHASWTARGFAASFPFESSDRNYNPTIHTANDTTATFGQQAEHALKFTQLALAWAVELGSD